VTDTVPLTPAKRIGKIRQLSVAPLIGEAIKRIHEGESVGALFSSELQLVEEMLLWEGNEPPHEDGSDGPTIAAAGGKASLGATGAAR
jgi:hypothetical protein